MATMQIESDYKSDVKDQINIILPYEKIGEYNIENLGEIPSKPIYNIVKRIIDIVISTIALIILCIPMIIIAIGIKMSSEGSIFYAQERLGLNGRKIQIIKFRTMKMDAESNGVQWSNGERDARIFPFGRKLRQVRLDEIPQFWCILKGDMTLVGPRPERECFYNEFETYIHGFSERLKVKPGLTGLAQVNGGYNLKPEEKIIYDVEYIKTRSILLDLKLIFKTVAVVMGHKGAK